MRSIRLSLIVYFLFLLAAALGGVSWLVYRSSASTLREKEVSTHRLIEAQYQAQCKEEREALDRRILRQAQVLASLARSSDLLYEPFFPLGALSAPALPMGYLNVPLWVAEGSYPPLTMRLRMRPVHIVIENAEEVLPFPDAQQAQEYYQTFHSRGQVMQRSESLGEYRFTLAEELKSELFVEKFDDVQLAPEHELRRVTLKTAVPRFRSSALPWAWRYLLGSKGAPRGPKPGPPSSGGNRPGQPPKGPFAPRPTIPALFDAVAPTIFIQYASDTSLRDAKLAAFKTERDDRLASLGRESVAALQSLRLRLLWICLAAFVGIVAGGYWLVRLGLAPLARLSEAVSQVSEKDFRLKIDQDRLPSELQPIAGRLAHTLVQLQRAFDREKQAAADISHELRTPLAAMMTTLEVALRKARSAAEYRDLLEDIRASGVQMTHLVERLLQLARLDAGADNLRPQPIDAAELARQCAHMVRPLAEARNLELRLDLPEPVPLETDPDKLREIVNNLLHNAIEYNREGGAIDMSVARVNGHLRLAVRDTGIGIPPQARANIFERFYRADPSRHADTPHAGLGLAIVKSYVDLMGGTIDVQSSDAGTTFTVELPVAA